MVTTNSADFFGSHLGQQNDSATDYAAASRRRPESAVWSGPPRLDVSDQRRQNRVGTLPALRL
jgi:hypothetical protein